MGYDIATAGAGMVAGGVTDLMNMANAKATEARQMRNAKNMAIFNKNQQIDLFNKTGYEATTNQMINAGLNPALLYKGGGAGGSTNLESGKIEAQRVESQGQGMAIQSAMAQAQIELAKSQANKNNVEAEKIAGVDTKLTMTEEELKRASIPEIASRMGVNEATATKLKQDAEIGKVTVPKIEAETTKIGAETTKTEAETKTIDALRNLQVNKMEQEVEALDTTNKYLDERQRTDIAHLKADIYKKIQDVKQGWAGLSVDERKNAIENWKAEMQADYPSLFNVIGRLFDRMQRGLAEAINGDKDELKRKN